MIEHLRTLLFSCLWISIHRALLNLRSKSNQLNGRALRSALDTLLLALACVLCMRPQPSEAQATPIPHQIQISNDADDGYYNNADGSGWHSDPQSGGADWVGSSSSTPQTWVIGYRFPSTGINMGDTIQSAYLVLRSSDGAATSTDCGAAPCSQSNSTFRVYGVAEDDGPSFSGATGNTPLDVPYTNSYTDYTTTGPGDDHGSCGTNTSNGVYNNNGQNTCTHIIDVTSIVQEITSISGWTSASAMRFVLTSTATTSNNVYAGYEDFSANQAEAAILIVNPPLPTIVSSGAWGTSASVTYPTTYPTGPFVYPGASTLLLYLGDYYNFYNEAIPQPTVSDSCGNTWNILAGPTDWLGQSYDMRSTVYYVQNPVQCSAGDIITVSTSVQEPIFLHFIAVANTDTTQLPVASAITSPAPQTYTTSASTNYVTLTNSGLLVSWIFGDSDTTHTFTPSTGFTTDVNSTLNYLTATYESGVSAGSYQNQYSISPSSDGWQTVLLALPAPPTGPPVITSSTTASAITGQAFSYQTLATNSPSSYSASGLPSGLNINSSTGLISGAITSTGTFGISLSATNGDGTGSATLSLTVAEPSTPTITWATPAAISYGTALSATELDASASVPGAFAYSPSAGTVLGAGTQTLSVTFTPTDTVDYTTATQTVQLTVSKASQTITFSMPATASYGGSPIALTATGGSSGNPVTFSVVSGPGTISGSALTITGSGTIQVAANQAGNANYLAATQVTQAIVVTTGTLTVAANNATRTYGTANPAFTGTVTGALNGDTFTESFSTTATTTSGVGTYAIIPGVAGSNLAAYSVTIQNGTLTVTQAGTTISLGASSTSINAGAPLTLAANVASATTGTPTGTVTFYDGTTQLGNSPLSAGVASLSTSTLSDGSTQLLTAVYSGDSNFLTSTTPSSLAVAVGQADFSLAVSGTSSATVTEGSTASYSLVANPLNGLYPGTVILTASGLPPGSTASFNPASIAVNAGQQTVTATIQTASGTVAGSSRPRFGKLARISVALLLLPILGARRLRRHSRGFNGMVTLILVLTTMTAAAALIGCGGQAQNTTTPPPQSYTVTLTATGGGVQHSVNVTLEVQ
jgi:Bacterial Ig-like domain (group 3)/MBG domain (YGX type)/Putative Ig domain